MSRLQYLWHAITLSPTRKALLGVIALATVLLTAGYLLGKLWVETPVVFLIGILWLVCVLRELRWAASPLFVFMLTVTAIGYMARLSHVMMLAVGCMSVLAWDLHHFEARLLDIADQETHIMERSHLQRVFIVITLSYLLIALDSFLQVRFRFFALVVVTVLAVIVLNQTMLSVRKPKKKPGPPK